ncbi:MAG: hypothetical protein M3N48_13455 [Verrucomicrobiota bacterium]|nr:hypothetical protein [Verrucomicrobiota bacterium]
MRLIPHHTPAPRLLKTALELRPRPLEDDQAGPTLTTGSKFSGKDRAVFAAIVLGAILLCFLTFTHWRQRTAPQPPRKDVKVPAVSTPIVAAAPIAKINADQIHVTAISLGDPRMAIINGRLVGEGEQITLHRPGEPVAGTLQVLKIFDGEVELSDGAQVIKARLALALASKQKR